MTRENIENTLFNIRRVVRGVKGAGLNVDRLIMGVDLIDEITYKSGYIINNEYKGITLFGLPVIIDYDNPYTLEVVTAYKVQVEGVG